MYRAISVWRRFKPMYINCHFLKIARSGVNGNLIDMEYIFSNLINNLLTLLYSPTDIRQQFHTWIK